MSEYSVSGGDGGVGGRNHPRRKRERERERALGPGDYLKNIASTRTGGGLENRRTMRLSGACNIFLSLSLFFLLFSFLFFFSRLFFPSANKMGLFYVRQSPEGCTRLRSRRAGRQVKQQGRGMTIAKKVFEKERTKKRKEKTYRYVEE